MLKKTLEEISALITNKSLLHFSHNEYQTMIEALSFYTVEWKADSLWETKEKVVELLGIICKQNQNFFAHPYTNLDNLDSEQDEAFNELQALLRQF